MGPFDRGGAHALPRNPGRVVLNRLEIFRARQAGVRAVCKKLWICTRLAQITESDRAAHVRKRCAGRAAPTVAHPKRTQKVN